MSKSLVKKNKEYFEMIFQKWSTEREDPWGHNWRAFQKYRHKKCLELLLSNNFGTKKINILDIGCSLGDFTVQVENSIKSSKIWAIDISDLAIKRARIKYEKSKINFDKGFLPDLAKFKDNFFDLVICLEVLYYLEGEDRIKSLEEIKRVTKKNGFLLISANIDKPPYFQIDEFCGLVARFFKIKKIKYDYGKIYSLFQEKIFFLTKVGFKKIVRCILSIDTLVIIGRFSTKIIFGDKGITQTYILAKKS